MEEYTPPFSEEYIEIDDEDIVMPDKKDTTPYMSQDLSSLRFESKR